MFEEFKQPFSRPNNTHVQIIVINVAVFLSLAVITIFSASFGDALYNQLAMPALFAKFIHKPWTIITYAFLHSMDDIFHILFNMLALYWFGRLFIEYLGSDKFVAVYVLGMLGGGVAYLLVYNFIPYYTARIPAGGMVGASAAIYAVVAAVATLLPNYTLYVIFLGPVKLKYIAGFYIGLSFLGMLGLGSANTAHEAHLGGAIMGFVYLRQLQAGRNWGGWITAFLDWVKSLFQPSPKVKVTYRREKGSKKSTKAQSDKISQDEIDAILDKISAGGYESLSREEKEKLFNASKKG